MREPEIIKTESHIANLNIAITHISPLVYSNNYPVLFIHGSSFPSALSFSFIMSNTSWMHSLSENGYDVYALDFLGYGNSDRYPEMQNHSNTGKPVGRAMDVYQDVDKAINLILHKTGKNKVSLIGHSWGGSVAALYASKFPDKIAKLVLFAALTPRQDTTVLQNVQGAYRMLTPEQRVTAMKKLTPPGKICQLEKEIFQNWGAVWLKSDFLATQFNAATVRYPSGPLQDIEDLTHNKPYYNPSDIKAPTLVIRGEWDTYPNSGDAELLFNALVNVASKKYVVVAQGTHVMHLEKSRYELYKEVLHFLQQGNNIQETKPHSIAVIFEVIPAEGCKQEYLDIAASLKAELDNIKGFISIERFQSIYNPEKILSLSFWTNEEAIAQWRNLEAHRNAQVKGQKFIFKDYHLRIAQVSRDYGMFERKEAPVDSKVFHQKG